MAAARPIRVQRGPAAATGLEEEAFTKAIGRTTGTSIKVRAIDADSLYQSRETSLPRRPSESFRPLFPRDLWRNRGGKKKLPRGTGRAGANLNQKGPLEADGQRIDTWASAEAVRWAGSSDSSTDFPATRSMVLETTCSLPSTTVATLIS